MESELAELMRRVDKLERGNARLKLAGLTLVLFVSGFVLAGARTPPRTIEAEKIAILDAHGRAKLTISTPAFAGVAVGTNPDDAVIWLSDVEGRDRAMLSADGLFFGNGRSKPTITLSSDPNGTSALRLYGANGKVSWSAP